MKATTETLVRDRLAHLETAPPARLADMNGATLSVALLVTSGDGSLDLYARRLAERLPVRTITSCAAGRAGRQFNLPLVSRDTARIALSEVRLLRLLREIGLPLHLPHHHLGRYGRYLRQPYAITVHDVIRFLDLNGGPALIHRPNLRDRAYLWADREGIRRAAAVVAVSEKTKRDLVNHIGIPESRIAVVPNGVDHDVFKPVTRRLWDFPYVLFVGSEHPRKNFPALLRAFARVADEPAMRDVRLVKVGDPGGPEAPFREATLRALDELGLRSRVVLAGRLADTDLPAAYSGALCLVLPSRYEGFGLPPLEAMACGCPVVVSAAGSLPEVVADAGVYVNPDRPESIARGLLEVAEPALAGDLRRRGLERAREFSWERTARETLRVYERLLD